jgi:hypothetical protein
MPTLHSPSRLSVAFDDVHAVVNAGLALVGLLSEKLGLQEPAEETISIVPFPGRRVATLVHALVAGATWIDDADMLRSGATSSVLAHRVMAPSTLGMFLCSFTFGNVRQLDRVSEMLIARALPLGAGAVDEPMTIDLDSTILEVYGNQRHGAAFGYLPLIATLRHWRDPARALSKGFFQYPARSPTLRARGGGTGAKGRRNGSVDAAL